MKSSVSLNFIKKEPVTGSYSGMRYRLSNSGEGKIEACIWPEPYNFIRTKDELKQYNTFNLDEEGIVVGILTSKQVFHILQRD